MVEVKAAYGKFSSDEDFPDLSTHNNYMAKALTKEVYANLRNKATKNGYTLDDVIQTGVDNPGKLKCFSFPMKRLLDFKIRLQWYFTCRKEEENFSTHGAWHWQ